MPSLITRSADQQQESALRNLIQLRMDPLEYFTRIAREQGDIAHFNIPGESHYLLFDPQHIRDFLVRDADMFDKAGLIVRMKKVLGNGLLTSDGKQHRDDRKRCRPAFNTDQLLRYNTEIPGITRHRTATWSPNSQIDMLSEITELTLEIICRILLGSLPASTFKPLRQAVTSILDYFSPGFIEMGKMVTGIAWYEFNHARKLIEDIVGAITEESLSGDAPPECMATVLARELHAAGYEGQELQVMLRDQIVTMLMAGHETVATGLTWTMYLLSLYPECEANLRDEVRRTFGEELPCVEGVDQLYYAEMILKESMRIFPPSWSFRRRAKVDYEVGGITIPAGASVGVSQWITHHDARYFDSPLEFRPERWTADSLRLRPQFSYFPFGGGPRACIGGGLAMFEMKLVLATIVQHWRWMLVPGQRIVPKPQVTLRPSPAINMFVMRP